ncbi:MAG: hypothetical protein HYZ54_08465 [Ignavibacteriae bacterium]|nr:hypothetical protein [Ignavibacteriota bacterium]
MKPVAKQSEIERTLNERLRFIGYILVIFAVITLIGDFLPEEEEEFDGLLLEMEEAPPPVLLLLKLFAKIIIQNKIAYFLELMIKCFIEHHTISNAFLAA